ncbi:hypothetical protein NEMIN01_0660 [Nematocida minor]|uniref:uncharacterized protein n=1 Tax=Nematocida minor TaxID=1912983 RepID=UPI0022204D09|nr:uncharacterized protein NEMIN01_0660 [Nematocida minor]KAI5189707.1 hypothetical protein NEMIN01_0660 [Nematocida minor]
MVLKKKTNASCLACLLFLLLSAICMYCIDEVQKDTEDSRRKILAKQQFKESQSLLKNTEEFQGKDVRSPNMYEEKTNKNENHPGVSTENIPFQSSFMSSYLQEIELQRENDPGFYCPKIYVSTKKSGIKILNSGINFKMRRSTKHGKREKFTGKMKYWSSLGTEESIKIEFSNPDDFNYFLIELPSGKKVEDVLNNTKCTELSSIDNTTKNAKSCVFIFNEEYERDRSAVSSPSAEEDPSDASKNLVKMTRINSSRGKTVGKADLHISPRYYYENIHNS